VVAHLEPLARGLSGRLADGLLWGNAASALAGALGVLTAARPDLREQAAEVASALLDTGLLRGTGDLRGTGELSGTGDLDVSGAGLGFRRRSCCLFYRLPGGRLCADCFLTRPPGRRPGAG
jgi:ferric iron reductase protein FhuF